MKYFSSIVILTLCFLNTVNAQDTIRDPKMYKTWITLNSEPYKTLGVLYAVKDSSIMVSNSLRNQDYYKGMFETMELNIKDIETIQIRNKNRIGNGMLIGAIYGAFAAVIFGTELYSEPWRKAMTLITAVPLMAIGGGIGAIIGSVKVKIPIGGSADNFNKNKTKLTKFSLLNE